MLIAQIRELYLYVVPFDSGIVSFSTLFEVIEVELNRSYWKWKYLIIHHHAELSSASFLWNTALPVFHSYGSIDIVHLRLNNHQDWIWNGTGLVFR